MKTRTMHANARPGARKGMSTMDMVLWMVLAMIVVVGIVVSYQKTKTSSTANSEFARVNAVIGGIDRVKLTNGGVYPALAAVTITAATFPDLVARLVRRMLLTGHTTVQLVPTRLSRSRRQTLRMLMLPT